MKYDSANDTIQHIKRVKELLFSAADELSDRGVAHDQSKLKAPEKELFDKFTPKLKGSTYGSEEYKENLKGLRVALDHHYSENSHHPEHYELWKCPTCGSVNRGKDTWKNEAGKRFCKCTGGFAIYECELTDEEKIISLDGFDAFELMEMFFDWKAATERHDDGDIRKSIEINKERFSISEQIIHIFENTADKMNW